MYELVASLSKSELENLFCGVVADAVAHLRAPLHRRAFTRTPYISRQHVETIPGLILRLRDVDTREDPEHQEELRIERIVSATTRAAARNDERRRHFVVAAHLEQLRRRMQRAREEREEQQRSRSRCVVS